MEDQQFYSCMEQMKAGDKTALREIYENYIAYVYHIIFQVVQNKEDAEDVTSEFFIKLWNRADSFKAEKGHKAWLATIARNMAIDFLRKRKKEVLTDEFVEEAAEENLEELVIEDISLQQALATLQNSEREIVHLKICGTLTFQEIANILGIPFGTVTWRYQNAIKKLKRCGYE